MTQHLPPSLAAIEALAQAARAAMPEPFLSHCADVAILVAEMPDDDLCDDLEIESPWTLTGLYDGIPLPERSSFDQPLKPDTVWLFQMPILLEWIERGDVPIDHLVAHVLVHEFAHHLGWSDDDIAAIDPWWE